MFLHPDLQGGDCGKGGGLLISDQNKLCRRHDPQASGVCRKTNLEGRPPNNPSSRSPPYITFPFPLLQLSKKYVFFPEMVVFLKIISKIDKLF